MPDNKIQLTLTAQDQTKGAFDSVANQTRGLEQGTSSLVSKLKQRWLGLSVAIAGAAATAYKAWDYINLGARAEQAEESFHRVAQAYKEDANRILTEMKRVSAGTVDSSDIMQKAVKGMVQGLSGAELVKIMEAARVSARVAGEDVVVAYENITDAIANNLPRALIRYGLVTKEQMKIVNAAIEAGVTDIDLYTLTMANAEKQAASFGAITENNAEKIQKFRASLQDLKESIGGVLIPIVSTVISVFQQLAAEIIKPFALIEKGINRFINIGTMWQDAVSRWSKSADEWANHARGISGSTEKLGGDVASADKKIKDMMENLKKQTALKKMQGDMEAAAKAARDLAFEVAKLQAATIREETEMIERLKKQGLEEQKKAEEEYLRLTQDACVARQQLEENLTYALADELQKRLLEVEKWAQAQDALARLSVEFEEEYEQRKTQIAGAAEKMRSEVTENYNAEQQREYEKYILDMTNFFEDVMVGKTKNAWEALLDWMRGVFYRFVAQIASRKIVIPIIAQIIPSTSGATQWLSASGVPLINPTQSPEELLSMGATQTGGLGGINSMFGSLSSLIGDFGGMLLGSMAAYEGFMVNLPNIFSDSMFNALSGALGTITPFLPLLGPIISALTGNWGGAIGGLAGFGGSLLLGASLGSIVPGIGTLIGGIIGSLLGGLLGDEKDPRMGISYRGSFNVLDRDFELGEAETAIEETFTNLRETLLKFAENMKMDTSKFFEEWLPAWHDIDNEEEFKKVIGLWIGEYARFTLGIEFERFQKQGEEILTTIMRIMTALERIPDVFEGINRKIAKITGEFDEIARFLEKMEDAQEAIKEIKQALKAATDPADAITYANQLKKMIYEKYMAEKALIEGLVDSIKQLNIAMQDFGITMQQKIDDLLGGSNVIPLLEKAMADLVNTVLAPVYDANGQLVGSANGPTYTEQRSITGETVTEQIANLQKYIGYLDQWVAENIAAIEESYSLQREALEEQIALSRQWKGILDSVEDQILKMRISTASPRDAFERLDYLKSEMDRVRSLYLGGTGEERAGYAGDLQQMISEYMSLAQQVYQRPSTEYQQIYDEMNGWLEEIRTDAIKFASTETDLLKQLSDIDSGMAEDIKAFKEQAAEYYQWAMEEGNRLYAEAIQEQTEKLAQIIGDKTVEQYLAELQERAVTQLEKIKNILKQVLEALVPGVQFATGGYAPAKTLAWVGEKEPEWVIPQSKMNQFGSQSININNHITVSASGNVDEKRLAKSISDNIFFSLEYGRGKEILKKVTHYG